jgi:hypothetical protein
MVGIAMLHFIAGNAAAAALDGSAHGRAAALLLLLMALLPVLLLDSTFLGRGAGHFRCLGHLPIARSSYGVAAWWSTFLEFVPPLAAFLLPLAWASPVDLPALLLAIPLFSLSLVSVIALLQGAVLALSGGAPNAGSRRGILQALLAGLYVGGVVWVRSGTGAWSPPAWSISPRLPMLWFATLDPLLMRAAASQPSGPPALAAAATGLTLLLVPAAIMVRAREFRFPDGSGDEAEEAPVRGRNRPSAGSRLLSLAAGRARLLAGAAWATLTLAHLWRDSRGLGRSLGLALASLVVMGAGIRRGDLGDLFRFDSDAIFAWRTTIYAYCVIAYWALQDFSQHSPHAEAAWVLLSAGGDPALPGRRVRRAMRLYLLLPYGSVVAGMLAWGGGHMGHACLESALIFTTLETLALALRALHPRHPFSLPHDRSLHAVGRQLLLTAIGTALVVAMTATARYSVERATALLLAAGLLLSMTEKIADRRARHALLHAGPASASG